MSFNQVRALNAAKCAVNNFGENAWNFLASAWYVSKALKKSDQVKKQVNKWYPYVCTCNEDADKFSALLGGNQETAAIMAACDEKAQQYAVKQRQNKIIFKAYNDYFKGGETGPWTNSTRPKNSNMTLPWSETQKIVEIAVNNMGWDWSKANLTKMQETFGDYDMANGQINGTMLAPFLLKVNENQGNAMNGIIV